MSLLARIRGPLQIANGPPDDLRGGIYRQAADADRHEHLEIRRPSHAVGDQMQVEDGTYRISPNDAAWGTEIHAWSTPSADHSFDDNADDSCAPNYAHDTAFRLLNSLFSDPACSWQCGGQGFESP